jgi:hypothetical protein
MLRPETNFVSVGADRVAYQVYGDGPEFLFLKATGARSTPCGSILVTCVSRVRWARRSGW